ncbi:MAG: NFACT RNA binding domain-containing protein [Acidithiobacillus sp.]
MNPARDPTLSMDTLQLWTAARYIAPLATEATLREAQLGPGWLRLCLGTHVNLVIAQHRAPLGLWLAGPCPRLRNAHPNVPGQLLRGFQLQQIDVPWADRILHLTWQRVSITKETQRRRLIAECFGGRGNLAVTDEDGAILWAWRWDRLDSTELRFLPGHGYVPPTRSAVPAPSFVDALREPLQLIAPRIRGQAEAAFLDSTRLAEALRARCANPDSDWFEWRSVDAGVLRYPLRLHTQDSAIPTEAALRLAAAPWDEEVAGAADSLAPHRQALQHLERRLEKVRGDLLRWQNIPDSWQRDAEALFRLPDATHPGGEVEVTDYRSDGIGRRTISVPAGYRLHDYARHMLRQRQRAQRGRAACAEQLAKLEQERARLLQTPSADAPGPTEKPRDPRRLPQNSSPAIESKEVDGFEILWGRNAKANDHLTFRLAQPWDLWFHVQDHPGSHVLLRRPRDRAVPDAVLEAAAQTALQFSNVQAKSADVDWTEVRHLKRHPSGSPGRVLYRRFQTRHVRRSSS